METFSVQRQLVVPPPFGFSRKDYNAFELCVEVCEACYLSEYQREKKLVDDQSFLVALVSECRRTLSLSLVSAVWDHLRT